MSCVEPAVAVVAALAAHHQPESREPARRGDAARAVGAGAPRRLTARRPARVASCERSGGVRRRGAAPRADATLGARVAHRHSGCGATGVPDAAAATTRRRGRCRSSPCHRLARSTSSAASVLAVTTGRRALRGRGCPTPQLAGVVGPRISRVEGVRSKKVANSSDMAHSGGEACAGTLPARLDQEVDVFGPLRWAEATSAPWLSERKRGQTPGYSDGRAARVCHLRDVHRDDRRRGRDRVVLRRRERGGVRPVLGAGARVAPRRRP